MGYDTYFGGELVITSYNKLSAAAVDYLDSILGEDCRDHPEWEADDLTHIDLEREQDVIKWNGAEKTYDLVEKINVVIFLMRTRFPEFALIGSLVAQGEDTDDKWEILVDDNRAVKNQEICPTYNQPI